MVMYATQLSTSYMLPAEGVPALKAAADTCDAATAFAKDDIANAVTEWWTQPAVDAVPWLKCRFRLFYFFVLPCMVHIAAMPYACIPSCYIWWCNIYLSLHNAVIRKNTHTSKW